MDCSKGYTYLGIITASFMYLYGISLVINKFFKTNIAFTELIPVYSYAVIFGSLAALGWFFYCQLQG